MSEENKTDVSSLQERLRAIRDAQKSAVSDKVDNNSEEKVIAKENKQKPKDSIADSEKPEKPNIEDPSERIRKRLQQARNAAEKSPEDSPQVVEKPKIDIDNEKSEENPADRLRALLEAHRAKIESEKDNKPPVDDDIKIPQNVSSKVEPMEIQREMIQQPISDIEPPKRPIAQPQYSPAPHKPKLRYRLRLQLDKWQKTKIGKLVKRFSSVIMRVIAILSLNIINFSVLWFMAGRYCSVNDMVAVYCPRGLFPDSACQTDYGFFDVLDMRYWQQLQDFYNSGFIIPWNYVYVIGGHALLAIVLTGIGLLYGMRVYQKMLRLITFPLRKLRIL